MGLALRIPGRATSSLLDCGDAQVWTASITLTVAVLGAYIFWLGYPRPLKGIPYNKEAARRWLGDIPSFQKHYARTGEGWDWMALQCQKLDSPIVQVFLGPYQKPAVVLVDHAEIRSITTRRSEDFDRGGFLTRWLSIIVPHGTIAMPTNARFRAQRAIWQGTMSGEFVNRVFAPQIQKLATSLVRRWVVKAELSQCKPFEASNDVRACIFEVVWSAAFGQDLDLLEQQSREDLTSGVQILEDEARFPRQEDVGILQSMAYLLDALEATRVSIIPFLHHRVLRQMPGYKKADSMKRRIIKDLLAGSKAKFDSSDVRVDCAMDFVYQRQQDKAERIGIASDAEMEDELVVFLAGGFESSSWNLSWALKHLAQNQSAQVRLHAELSEVFPSANHENLPSARDITSASLPYLDAVVQETLRLSRTNAGALRIATRDTQIYGHFIPQGTDLYGVHSGESAVIEPPPRPSGRKDEARPYASNKTSWEHGTLSQFQPERWLQQDATGRWIFDPSSGPFLAFGTGLRSCFGQRLARTTLRLTMVTLFVAFDFAFLEAPKASMAAEEKLVRMAKSTFVQLKIRDQ